MAKKKKGRGAKDERKPAKSRAALQDGLAKLAKVQKRGNKEMEKARALAEQWRVKAQDQVQQLARSLTRIETRLRHLTSRSHDH